MHRSGRSVDQHPEHYQHSTDCRDWLKALPQQRSNTIGQRHHHPEEVHCNQQCPPQSASPAISALPMARPPLPRPSSFTPIPSLTLQYRQPSEWDDALPALEPLETAQWKNQKMLQSAEDAQQASWSVSHTDEDWGPVLAKATIELTSGPAVSAAPLALILFVPKPEHWCAFWAVQWPAEGPPWLLPGDAGD